MNVMNSSTLDQACVWKFHFYLALGKEQERVSFSWITQDLEGRYGEKYCRGQKP